MNDRYCHSDAPAQKGSPAALPYEVAFGYPRDFLSNRFVYLVISPRANGLSIGINLNASVRCNLNCLYCEVDRHRPPMEDFDVDRMVKELGETLELVQGGWLRQWPRYAKLPKDLLEVRHVALSGDGEPTLSKDFIAATQAVMQLRQRDRKFKTVLVTNSAALDRPEAQAGMALLAPQDEVWAKLDAGTQEYFARVNGANLSLDIILSNILLVARRRPVVIQSLFPAIDKRPPAPAEIWEYACRLKELVNGGAQISLVQIYSVTRPPARSGCSHLPLRELSHIARTVRDMTGLRAEVF